MRVLILIEDRPDGQVEVVIATAGGAGSATFEPQAGAQYTAARIAQELQGHGFTLTEESHEHGSD